MGDNRNRWTPEEDAILREHRDHGASWEGFRELLPGRSRFAIISRRNALGIRMSEGARGRMLSERKHALDRRTPPGLRRRVPSAPWSDEQRIALVRLATEMVDACGHDLRECLQELARVIGEHRRGARCRS